VGVVAVTDFNTSSIIGSCILISMVSGVAVGADCQLEGALSDTTHTLSVECVHWSGLYDAHSGNDMIDVIHPSQDTMCILSSLEVVHVSMIRDYREENPLNQYDRAVISPYVRPSRK
jgi:hypothetical protein